MSAHDQAVALAGGAVAAATAGGPLATVFNELGLVMALMGGFGGIAWVLAIALPWRQALRPVVFGSIIAFGFGVISPVVLQWATGITLAPDTPMIPLLAATSFTVGFLQDWIVRKMRHAIEGDQE